MAATKESVFAEIAEADATGPTRRIYDDLRAATGLPMVNLVYRHMATTPGCLDWAWARLRPLFAGGAIAAEAGRLVAGLALGERPPVSHDALRDAGVDAAARSAITRTLEAYNRANPMNLIAMAVLARELDDPDPDRREAPPETGPIAPPPSSTLPPMADIAALPDQTRELLGVLAAQAGVGGGAVVPSLYRHLTDWPGYLEIAVREVAPLVEEGGLDRAASTLRDEARRAAAAMPRHAAGHAPPSARMRDNLLGLIEQFPVLISRMIVIGVHLDRSMAG